MAIEAGAYISARFRPLLYLQNDHLRVMTKSGKTAGA
jgi:hypothetical protein